MVKKDAPFTSLTVDLLGLSSNVENLRLYWDTNDNGLFGGEDRLLATGIYGDGAYTFSPLTETCEALSKNYFLVMNVAEDAQPGQTLGLQITVASDIDITLPNTIDTTTSEDFQTKSPYRTGSLKRIALENSFLKIILKFV